MKLLWTKYIFHSFFLFFASTSEVFINGSFSKNVTSPEVLLDRICINANPIKCLNKPELEKNSYLSNLFSNYSIFLTEDELVASFECEASYPVEWVYSQEKWITTLAGNNWLALLPTRITKFTRIASDIHNPSTFRYSAVLIVTHVIGEFQQIVGQYKCRSIADPTEEATTKAISVFSEGNIYEKAFALSRKNVTVWIGETEDNPIIFPCHVINPSVAESAKLFMKVFHKPLRLPPRKLNFTRIKIPPRILSNKTAPVQSMESWVEIQPNSNIRFVPELGWVYNKSVDKFTKFPNSFKLSPGSYKCTMDEESDDWVGIQLENGKEPKPSQFDEPIVSNATITYSRGTNQSSLRIKCCSSTANPPKLYTIDCYNRFTCEQQKKHFASLDSRRGVYKGIIRVMSTTGNCVESVSVSYTFFIPINVRCTGDGINYSKTVYIPLVDRNRTYTSWEAVDPYKMVELYPKDWDWKAKDTLSTYKRSFTHYEGETTNFQCVIVSSYFSIGSKVEVEFKNGSTITAKEGTDHHDLIKRAFGVYTLTLTITMKKYFKSLHCYAPVLNSDRWVKKTLKLNVIDGNPPNIFGTSEREVVFWTLNDTMKTLECEFSGNPMPTNVEWKKDSVVIKTNNHYNVSILHGNTSVLLVSVATYEIHGVYTCTAASIVGSTTKTFQVFVRASETYWTIVSVCLGILCLVSVLAFLIFKTWKQRKNLDTTRSKG